MNPLRYNIGAGFLLRGIVEPFRTNLLYPTYEDAKTIPVRGAGLRV